MPACVRTHVYIYQQPTPARNLKKERKKSVAFSVTAQIAKTPHNTETPKTATRLKQLTLGQAPVLVFWLARGRSVLNGHALENTCGVSFAVTSRSTIGWEKPTEVHMFLCTDQVVTPRTHRTDKCITILFARFAIQAATLNRVKLCIVLLAEVPVTLSSRDCP